MFMQPPEFSICRILYFVYLYKTLLIENCGGRMKTIGQYGLIAQPVRAHA